MDRSQLESVCARVNLAVLSLDTANPDHELLDALSACGIDEAELGSAFETGTGDWFWYHFQHRKCILTQYKSGRLALIGG